jgi:RNA polymerase sigma-70 factor, ECF subfamily
LRSPHLFPYWFRQIIRSQCSRATRKNTLQTVPLDTVITMHATSDDPAIRAEVIDLHAQVMAALEKLPVHEQTVVRLFYLKEFSVKEIARVLEIPITTVKKRLQYGRERMHESLCQFAIAIAIVLVPAQPCFVYHKNPKRQAAYIAR